MVGAHVNIFCVGQLVDVSQALENLRIDESSRNRTKLDCFMNFIIRVLLVPEIGEFSQDEIVSRRLKFLLRAVRFTTGIALFSSERRRHFSFL